MAEINGLGGNYSFEDFANYSVIERNVTVSSYMGFPLLSTPPPSAGAVLSMILSVLEGMYIQMTRGPFGACDSLCYGNSYCYICHTLPFLFFPLIHFHRLQPKCKNC